MENNEQQPNNAAMPVPPTQQTSPQPVQPTAGQVPPVQPGAGQMPVAQQVYADSDSTLTLGAWMLNLLIVAIPLVGLIMMLVWSFGSTTAPAKKNWARATLIWYVIAVVLSFLFSGLILAAMASMYGADPYAVSSYSYSL